MTTQTEALKLALEALETCYAGDYSTGHVIDPSFDEDAVEEAITAIKEALAQPEQTYKTKMFSYDLSPAMIEGEIRDKLIEMGWTPPQPDAPEQEQHKQELVAFPDAPQTIYLQIGDGCPEDAKWKELIDVCWCDEQVFDNDIVYVRADTTPPQRKPLTNDEAVKVVQGVVSTSYRPIGAVALGLLVLRATEKSHSIKEQT